MAKTSLRKYSKPIIHGVLGNAAYQLLIGGGAAVLPVLAARSAYIQGLALYWVILLGACIFFISAAGVNMISLAVVRYRYPSNKAFSVADITEEIPLVDVKGSTDRIAELEDEIAQCRTMNERMSQTEQHLRSNLEEYKWLHELAEQDRRIISRYVYINFREVKFEGLEELSPYIEIVFDIINASVYVITIDKNIEDGAISFNNARLNPKQTEILGPLQYISRNDRGEQKVLIIKQWLSPTEAERIKYPQPEDKFYFGNLRLTVRGADETKGVMAQRLSLPSSVDISE